MGIQESYENEINELLEEKDEIQLIQEDGSWKIDNLQTAVWADSMIHNSEVLMAEKEKIADDNIAVLEEKIKKLQQWKEDTTKKEKHDVEFFTSHLISWHIQMVQEEEYNNKLLRDADKKEKKISSTIKLPYRDLRCRKQQPEATINGIEIAKAKDDPEFVKFVKENNPEFIKEEVKWGDYKKFLKLDTFKEKPAYFDDAGQRVELIRLTEQPNKFDAKPSK